MHPLAILGVWVFPTFERPEVETLLKNENFENFRSPIIFDWGN